MIKRLEDRAEILVAGHRGIKTFYPENTLLSFKKALELKVDMIEFDLNLTKDKQIVIIHDNTLERTTNGTGLIHDYALCKIKQMDAGKWFAPEFEGLKIPTLIEFCDLISPYDDLLLNVEIKEKTHETVDIAMQVLKEYGLIERSVFTCFDAEIIGYMHDGYGVKTQGFPGFLMQNFVEGETGTYAKLYAVGIAMKYLTPELVQEFEARGILPWAYCPDTGEQVNQAVECGARLVTVNNPEPALRVLGEKGLRKYILKDPQNNATTVDYR